MRLIDADALIMKLDEQIQMPTFMDCLSAINSAPSINMGDLISRNDVINVISENYGEKHFTDAIIELIERIPTTEPKRGEWVERETFLNIDRTPIIEEWQSAMCSVCHRYHTTPYLYYFNDYNFCPNCGADMRERKEK